MGLNWGFSLENTETKQTIRLISFSGWNGKELLSRCSNMGTSLDEYNTVYDEQGLKELLAYGQDISRIETILHGISNRKIEFSEYTKKQQDQLFDLFYDLAISYDEFIIFDLRRLNVFLKFIGDSDLFEKHTEPNRVFRLVLWKSF